MEFGTFFETHSKTFLGLWLYWLKLANTKKIFHRQSGCYYYRLKINKCWNKYTNESMCMVGKGEKENNNVDETVRQADMAKSVPVDCDAGSVWKKGVVCCYCWNGVYLSTGGIPNKEATQSCCWFQDIGALFMYNWLFITQWFNFMLYLLYSGLIKLSSMKPLCLKWMYGCNITYGQPQITVFFLT